MFVSLSQSNANGVSNKLFIITIKLIYFNVHLESSNALNVKKYFLILKLISILLINVKIYFKRNRKLNIYKINRK